MTAQYKVWLEIELVDDDLDVYQTMQNPECLGAYEHLDDAQELVDLVNRLLGALKKPGE